MLQRKTFDLSFARTAGMLSGARRVAMLLATLLLTMIAQTAWADGITSWTELQTALSTGGEITLTQDITATENDTYLNVPQGVTVTLDLAGHTIDRGLYNPTINVDTPKENGLVFKVFGTLTLNDTGTGGKLTGANNKYKNNVSPDGGCIYVDGSGTFILNGGEITYNKASTSTAGGGVYVNGTMTMNGGIISHNETPQGGGGICIASSNPNTFTLTGGIIEYNSANEGGGIDARGNTPIIMSGGTISNNSATSTSTGGSFDGGGGGICTKGGGPVQYLTITGGTITGNTSNNYGGGISIITVTAKITNATITNNTANYSGGAIYRKGDISEGKHCIINGNTTITGNSSNGTGGAIYSKGHVVASGTVQIKNNTTGDASSGAVNLYQGSNLYVAGSIQITGNTKTADGSAANVKLNDGNIINGVTDNNATTYLSSGASIGVKKGNPLEQDVLFLAADETNNSESTLGYFSSDEDYLIKYDNGALKLSAYTITIPDGVPLSASQSRATEGTTITLTPNEGSQITYVIYNDGSDHIIEAGNGVYTFTMPAHDVSVIAGYSQEKHDITISSLTNGTIVSNKTQAIYGETVTLTITPDAGYVLKSISVTANGSTITVHGLTTVTSLESTYYNNSSATFMMHAYDVTVSAEFMALSDRYVTIPKTGEKESVVPSGITAFKVYDNSGKNGSYTFNDDGKLLLTVPEGYVINVSGYVKLYYSSDDQDYLDIYDGNSTTATSLGRFKDTSGNNNTFTQKPVSATSSTNQMLLHFVTNDYGYVSPGGGVYLTVTLVPVLSETAGITSADAASLQGKMAQFSRTFTASVSSTLCLPFPMTGITGGTAYEFTAMEKVSDVWTATMSAVTSTEAGKPYLFMAGADGAVSFSGTVPNDFTGVAASSAPVAYSGGGTWTFCGTYTTLTYGTNLDGAVYGFAAQSYAANNISPGNFVKAETGAYVPPFRCYLRYTAPSNARGMTRGADIDLPSRIIVRLLGLDGQTTAIGSMDTKTGEVSFDGSDWYTLDGRQLIGKPTQRGIYINNGKKVIVK